MKKNKVILVGMAGLALVAAIAPAALAADASITTPQQKESHVTYEVTAGYEWSVPRMIDFGMDKGVNATSKAEMKGEDAVKVTRNVIPDGKNLHITIEGNEGAFQIKNGNTALSYTVSKVGTDGISSTHVKSGDEVLTVPAGTNAASQDLSFVLSTSTTGTAEVAGNYIGTAVFTAQVE